MAFRIEYYRDGKAVMAMPCPKNLDEAIKDARRGLETFDASKAYIRDVDGHGRQDTVIERVV